MKLPTSQAATGNASLYHRAQRVIPGGIPGHQSPALAVPGKFPSFAKRAEGPYYWDVEDRRFIDFMCGYGPLVLGAKHPEVDKAYLDALTGGNCFNHPTEWTVLLAERLVEIIDIADWAFFGKNGADMTYWAVRVAREHTARDRIIKVRHAYHGTDPWCSERLAGVLPQEKASIVETPWNDIATLKDLVNTHRDHLAGIVTTPFDHPAYADMTLPDPAFLEAIRAHCDTTGAAWILDDVRAGFRHHLGGSHRYFGFSPDLICYSKAIANGYALSATVGRRAFRAAASRIFATGTFWNNPAPMAAALKTMEVLERDDCISGILRRGKEWMEAFVAMGSRHGVALQASGTPALPFIRIREDAGFFKQQTFCSLAVEEGLFLHPHHNWFIGAAHTDAVLEESLSALDRTFRRYNTARSG